MDTATTAAGDTPMADDRKPEALVARQLRLNQEEHDALTKAAPRGEQNRFIRQALREKLVRRGMLKAPADNQRRLPLKRR